MIQRMFHPIGQGAFYSERHEHFNIVYDCGNFPSTKVADLLVKNSFSLKSIIDILFISHFDFDHVSKIHILKQNFSIKKVVVPLLHQKEKIFLVNFYKNIGFIDIVSLINDPSEYFGSETIIITVDLSENHEGGDEETGLDISTITSDRIIKSGTRLEKGSWCFIPFNFEYDVRKKQLKSAFQKKGLDIKKFEENIDYKINNKKTIKEIYNLLSGKINQNSMLVYSGPINSDSDFFSEFRQMNNFLYRCTSSYFYDSDYALYKPGCIYTGDANLNITKVDLVFKKYWINVSTIQIPHHGELNSHNINFNRNDKYFCPISVGLQNSYGHPSNQVIADIYKKNSFPILVTEKVDSLFIQIIDFI